MPLYLSFICWCATNAAAETLRGTVRDAISGETLVGAAVRIVELPSVGTVADLDGNYVINLKQSGRYTVEASFIGYETSVLKEVLISGNKEVVIDIELREVANELAGAVVRPRINKMSTVNPNVLTGGIMLSMEEASRIAGGANDPARLMSAYAGISGDSDGCGISVHGNAPERMQYRIEGVEVFTPNHYNDVWNAGYGLVSGLNANVIGNSDFFTSTFNANYNNALSGVFDVKMRSGNNTRHENILQLGTAFEELTLEGPLAVNSKSSYIVNYRYGFSSLVDKIGLIDAQGTHLDFQDFSWKVNVPTAKAGSFSFFGLGLYDSTEDGRVDLADMHSAYDASNNDGKMVQILAGVSHRKTFDSKWTLRSTLAYNMQHINMNLFYYGLERSADNVLLTPLAFEEPQSQYLFSKQRQNEDRILFNGELSKQVTPKWLAQFGVEYSHRFFDLNYRSVDYVYADPSTMRTYTDMKDNTGLASAFTQHLFSLRGDVSLSVGITANYFLLSKDFSLEPRVSVKWQPDDKNTVSFGYGLHSMMEKLDAYFYRNERGALVNKDLDLTKSHNLMASYAYRIGDNLNVRVNAYFQYGFDTPVGVGSSTYCVCNRYFAYTDEALSGVGKTRNYGGDITLEQYMNHGFFGQTNLSVFKSEYRDAAGIWHNQLYDRGFMFKILGGKEWIFGNKVLSVSAKYCIQGGLRYTPIDVAAMRSNISAGILDDTPVYFEDRAFSERFDPTGIVDLTISYKINRKKVSHTIAFEGLNVLDSKAPLNQRFDLGTLDVRTDKNGISLPNVFYRLDF